MLLAACGRQGAATIVVLGTARRLLLKCFFACVWYPCRRLVILKRAVGHERCRAPNIYNLDINVACCFARCHEVEDRVPQHLCFMNVRQRGHDRVSLGVTCCLLALSSCSEQNGRASSPSFLSMRSIDTRQPPARSGCATHARAYGSFHQARLLCETDWCSQSVGGTISNI